MQLAGRFFVWRIAAAIVDGDEISADEWFRHCRIVMPVTSNRRADPGHLEEAWRARQGKARGLLRREIARELGYVTDADLDAAAAEKNRRLPGQVHSNRLASAEKRIARHERLLVACEQRIIDAGLKPPAWLLPPPARVAA